MQSDDLHSQKKPAARAGWQNLLVFGLLCLVLVFGASFRLVGSDWDEGRHLHPDERFLSMVLSSIEPVKSPAEYFNSDISSLNPGNRGYDFFVYGTLPIFIIRYVGEWTAQTSYDAITYLGRLLSAMAELGTILLVFLIGFKLYDKWVGLLAAAFYAFAVLPIQQAHFMTVDTFTNLFGMTTVLAVVLISQRKTQLAAFEAGSPWRSKAAEIWPYLFFGLALGAATASKINAAALALLLPAVEAVRYFHTPPEQRPRQFSITWKLVLTAALVSLVTFRLGQPYAFKGPGFFNIGFNPEWLSGMQSLRAQSAGEVDFPPALQWARRPWSFSLENLLLWGLGLPFGLTAVFAFLAMGCRAIKAREHWHLPLWGWTAFYFLWQSLSWVKSMRYQLLIYPLLALITAWGIISLIRRVQPGCLFKKIVPVKWLRGLGVVLLIVSLGGAAAWSFAFTRIYTRPHSRIAATEWIYENIPGPLNLVMTTSEGGTFQQLPYRANDFLDAGKTAHFSFQADEDGLLKEFTIPSVTDLTQTAADTLFTASVRAPDSPIQIVSLPALAQLPQPVLGVSTSNALTFYFDPPVAVTAGSHYVVQVNHNSPSAQMYLSGVPTVRLENSAGETSLIYLPKIVETIQPDHSYSMEVSVLTPGAITAVNLPYVLDQAREPGEKTLKITLLQVGQDAQSAVSGQISSTFLEAGDGRGTAYTIPLAQPLLIEERGNVYVNLEMTAGEGQIAISSVAPALETSWDDALPVAKDGYVPYSDSGGIFRGDLNLELYWQDDQSKLSRFEEILSQADYLFISSNRQWGTIPRVPERYPLTTEYYRSLMGCPEALDVVSCYNVALPGMYQGSLGFELVYAGTSFPNLGSLQFNDQFAEEAFSVYDHPKTLIFRKTADFDIDTVQSILGAIDLTSVVNLTARQADDYKVGKGSAANQLMLSADELARQRAGGTWAEIFDRQSWVNQHQAAAVLVFYLFGLLMGLAVFPLVRMVFPGLDDQGYPVSRLIGFLLMAVASLWLGSAGVSLSRTFLAALSATIALTGLVVGWFTRAELAKALRENWKKYLLAEVVGILAFAMFLWIRYQNPDLWHPWRGGEKPMDFSYLNAVIKSSTLPAYDPWFAGGFINYYYFGQLMMGLIIKLLGVVPAVAYNIILPLWYSMLIMAAYSFGWNLYRGIHKPTGSESARQHLFGPEFWAGIFTAALLAFLGNLGTVKVLVDGLKALGAAGQAASGVGLFKEIGWIFSGLIQVIRKVPLPVPQGSWYWNPSRTIPGDPITEFPFFTYLYADLHAHLIAMPFVVLAALWGLSVIRAKGRWGKPTKFDLPALALGLFVGALIIGALKPTNTWDYYTFLVLNLCALAYVGWTYWPAVQIPRIKLWPWLQKAALPLGSLLLLALLSRLLYLPFNQNFYPGFSQIGLWSGDRTPLASYLTHWGLILFILVFWFAWETYQWMAVTPMETVRAWLKYKNMLVVGACFAAVLLLGLVAAKVVVALLVIPLGLWALFLLTRPGQPDAKRYAFFMIGTALLLTLVVEMVYLVGDIGRMNVVFKLYLQAWILFTLGLGTGFVSLWNDQRKWTQRTQILFQLPALLLITGALLFPLMGTLDKINDRMDPTAAHTLDGMAYMASSTYVTNGITMDLGEDYRAIMWMQEHISGSPVILEAQAYEYQWGNRFTIYTGLPAVVGWNYHQRQQRAILRSEVVQQRVDGVNAFYLSQDEKFVSDYLKRYDVRYIIVGQLERATYSPAGLDKFIALEGILWDEVYRDGSTSIYAVR